MSMYKAILRIFRISPPISRHLRNLRNPILFAAYCYRIHSLGYKVTFPLNVVSKCIQNGGPVIVGEKVNLVFLYYLIHSYDLRHIAGGFRETWSAANSFTDFHPGQCIVEAMLLRWPGILGD